MFINKATIKEDKTHMRKTIVLVAFVSVLAAESNAGNKTNPNAIELVPIPRPVEFISDMDAPVAFDAGTTVVVECPDAAAQWLRGHFTEWFGAGQSPKMTDYLDTGNSSHQGVPR